MKDNFRNYIINKTRNFIKNTFFGIGILVLIFSLFNIKVFENKNEIVDGNDITFILDTSKSMDVEDMKYNSNNVSRLDFAKEMIKNFISSNPNNSYSLIAFAGNANIISPLTTEFNTFINFLNNLNSKTISDGGTNFLDALKLGIGTVGKNSIRNFVIINDGGEQQDKIDRLSIKSLIEGKKIKIFSIGVGSNEGDKIPIGSDLFGNKIYKTYEEQVVISKLYEKNLTDIKDLGNGKYIKAGNIEDLNKIKAEFINSANSKIKNTNNESQRYLVIIAGILLFIGYLIPNKKKKGVM
ncbi:VWA domain-containing protein [Candidatus Gracilibacteria bacterium]|nr:VWA domain-containing protein [Candidatus Gracilibacteria bacterium]